MRFASVYFDCDSTLSGLEGVDELLAPLDPTQREDFLALTQRAMDGTAALAEIFETRLHLLAPHRDQLDEVGRRYVEHVVPHAREVISALQWLGLETGVISGGLLIPVRHLAEHLGIPLANVHAVPLLFDEDGSFHDFDRGSPLWRNGGKVEVIRALPPDHRPIAFVGDGVTDLETQGTVDRFIGFGGVTARAAVREGAERFVDGPSLAPVLRQVLSDVQLGSLLSEPAFHPLLSAVLD